MSIISPFGNSAMQPGAATPVECSSYTLGAVPPPNEPAQEGISSVTPRVLLKVQNLLEMSWKLRDSLGLYQKNPPGAGAQTPERLTLYDALRLADEKLIQAIDNLIVVGTHLNS